MKKRIAHHLRVAVVLSSIAVFSASTNLSVIQKAQANSLQNEMSSMFDGMMSNTTDPGVIESARRGGISGGSFTARSDIMNVRPVDWVTPSFSAGCGGIDMTGGSFSFINADQFIEFAKTTAQNAIGYAFYLAIESFMPSVRAMMQNLQETVGQMNQFFGNSCRTAQKGVNALLGAENNQAALETTRDGIGDLFQSFSTADGRSADEEQSNNEEVYANLIWKELKEGDVQNWFSYGDNQFLEILMNVTGTFINGGTTTTNSDGENVPERQSLSGNTFITLEMLVDPDDPSMGGSGSGQASYIQCANQGDLGPDGCTNLNTNNPQNVNLEGFAPKAYEYMDGILDKIYVGQPPTSDQQAFLSSLPSPVPSMLFRLSRINPTLARSWAKDYSRTIGLTMAYQLVSEVHKAGMIAANNSTNTWSGKLKDVLLESREGINQDYDVLRGQYGDIGDALEEYQLIMQSLGKSGLASPGLFGTDSSD